MDALIKECMQHKIRAFHLICKRILAIWEGENVSGFMSRIRFILTYLQSKDFRHSVMSPSAVFADEPYHDHVNLFANGHGMDMPQGTSTLTPASSTSAHSRGMDGWTNSWTAFTYPRSNNTNNLKAWVTLKRTMSSDGSS